MRLCTGYIHLRHLRFRAFHGVLEQERLTGNDYDVSARVGYDLLRAAETDDVSYALNYAEVYEQIAEEMQQPSALLERVGVRIANRLFLRFPNIVNLDLEITKLNPPMGADCEGAGVEMHFENDGPCNPMASTD